MYPASADWQQRAELVDDGLDRCKGAEIGLTEVRQGKCNIDSEQPFVQSVAFSAIITKLPLHNVCKSEVKACELLNNNFMVLGVDERPWLLTGRVL